MTHTHPPPPSATPRAAKEQGGQDSTTKSAFLSRAQLPALLKKLESHLPHSIPLVGRLQFYYHGSVYGEKRRRDGKTTGEKVTEKVEEDGMAEGANAKVFVAAVDSSAAAADGEEAGFDDVDSWLRSSPSSAAEDEQPWIAAYIDLTNAGQTQVWVYASWEPSLPPSPSSFDSSRQESQPSLQQKLLFHRLYTTLLSSPALIPSLPTSAPASWLSLLHAGKWLSQPYSRDKVLFGTVHLGLARWFPVDARTRTDDGYWKYIFRVDGGEDEGSGGVGAAKRGLPHGYKFAETCDSHLQTVLDRTPVPRTLQTLRDMRSVGVFLNPSQPRGQESPSPSQPRSQSQSTSEELELLKHKDAHQAAVAWGFLSKDGSLSSLHTEPEHRGKGLAVALGRELLRRQHFDTSTTSIIAPATAPSSVGAGGGAEADGKAAEVRYAHVDVSKDNKPSRRVMEKLGGEPSWMVMWTEMDMRKALALLERL